MPLLSTCAFTLSSNLLCIDDLFTFFIYLSPFLYLDRHTTNTVEIHVNQVNCVLTLAEDNIFTHLLICLLARLLYASHSYAVCKCVCLCVWLKSTSNILISKKARSRTPNYKHVCLKYVRPKKMQKSQLTKEIWKGKKKEKQERIKRRRTEKRTTTKYAHTLKQSAWSAEIVIRCCFFIFVVV